MRHWEAVNGQPWESPQKVELFTTKIGRTDTVSAAKDREPVRATNSK
jgi:hypothetical protein